MKWEACPEQVSLTKTDVHLWRIDLDLAPQQTSRLQETLSPEETAQAIKFQFERDRRRFRVAQGALRAILSRYLGCTPRQVNYRYTSKGKPFLVNSTDLYFNLSHSHERALIAVAHLHPIGIDIEQIRPLENLDAMARQCFSESEYQQFTALTASNNLQAFFNAWTRKESFIKAIGDGLSYPLANFDVSLRPGDPAKLLAIAGDSCEARAWTLLEVEAGVGYAATLAVRATDVSMQYWDFAL